MNIKATIQRLAFCFLLSTSFTSFTASAIDDTKPFQLALFDPIQLFSRDISIHGLRINIIRGSNFNVNGIDIGIMNKVENEFRGLGIGLFSYAEGDVRGLQIGPQGFGHPQLQRALHRGVAVQAGQSADKAPRVAGEISDARVLESQGAALQRAIEPQLLGGRPAIGERPDLEIEIGIEGVEPTGGRDVPIGRSGLIFGA